MNRWDVWAERNGYKLSGSSRLCLHGLRRKKCPQWPDPCIEDSLEDYYLLDHARIWLKDGKPACLLAHSYWSGPRALLAMDAMAYAINNGCRAIVGNSEDAWYGFRTIPIRYEVAE